MQLQPLVHSRGGKRDRGPPAKLTQPVKVSVRELWQHTRGVRGTLALGTVAMVGAAVTAMLIPRILGEVVDSMSAPADDGTLQSSLLFLVAIIGVRAAFSGARRAAFIIAGEDVVRRLRARLLRAILSRPKAFFDTSMSGELVNRLSSDCVKLRGMLSSDGPAALRALVSIAIGIVNLVLYSPPLTGVMLAVVPFVAVSARIYGTRIKRLGRRTQDALALATAVAAEVLGNIETVKGFSREEACGEEYTDKVEQAFQIRRQFAFASGLFMFWMTTAAGGAIVLVTWFGASLVRDGSMTTGDFTAFLMYTMTVGFDSATLTGVYTNILSALGSSEQVFRLLHDEEPETGDAPALLRGELALHNVSFAYPARPDVPVLRDVSLTLAPGRTVALVGPSGGGKSTVVSLLLRFYAPASGRLTVDGVDAATLSARWLRQHVGLVSQSPSLLSTSIRQNVAFGRPGASEAEILDALQAANALDFVQSFPDGLDTLVGERGVQLSGGQAQRVAIARALVKNPRVLLLDEATSALDAESEHQVQLALDRLLAEGADRAFLVIAHRLSTVRGADEVLVLADGCVEERGTHAELLAAGGVYAGLVSRQLSPV